MGLRTVRFGDDCDGIETTTLPQTASATATLSQTVSTAATLSQTASATATLSQTVSATATLSQTASATAPAPLLDLARLPAEPQPQPHSTATATAQHRNRTSILPNLGSLRTARPSLARVPRARRFRGESARNSRHSTNPATPRNPVRTRSGGDRHRAVSERQRGPARKASRQQSGRGGEYCDHRVPDRQTIRRLTTSNCTMGRRFYRVGLKGTSGLGGTEQGETEGLAGSRRDAPTTEREQSSRQTRMVETPGTFTPRRLRQIRPNYPHPVHPSSR
jgi:hypothetical protein